MKKRSLLGVILLLLGIAIVFFIHQGVNCHFRPMDNCKGRTVRLDMDLEDAVTDGIYLPSKRQTDDGSGLFTFRFIAPKKDLFYKIYYQNETYKFPDTSALADENGDLVVCFLSTNLIDELDIHKSEPQPLREEEETPAE